MHDRRFVPHDGDMALPEQKIASPQLLELVRASERAPSARSCMSVSRGQGMPQATSASCTNPEQSRPRLVLPPHK